METKKENTVQENATSNRFKLYRDKKLILYFVNADILRRLLEQGILTKSEYKKAIELLAKKHHLSPSSTFVSIELDIDEDKSDICDTN